MSVKKLNSRFITYNKLNEAKLTNTRDIQRLSLEDVKDIIQDPIFKNIILLRKYIREKKILQYFNYDKTTSKYRMIAFRKLIEINKVNEIDVAKLQLEDLYEIINNQDFYNILLLRQIIKTGNSFDYFNENIRYERMENKNEQQ